MTAPLVIPARFPIFAVADINLKTLTYTAHVAGPFHSLRWHCVLSSAISTGMGLVTTSLLSGRIRVVGAMSIGGFSRNVILEGYIIGNDSFGDVLVESEWLSIIPSSAYSLVVQVDVNEAFDENPVAAPMPGYVEVSQKHCSGTPG